MSKSSAEGRQRVIETAASILSTRGLKGVSIREVAKLANAPLGSTYHHFPEGKVQIITEAIEWAGEKAAERLKGCLDKDNRNGLQTFLHQWRERLHRSNFQQGCPIVAAAIEASQDEHEEQIKLAISRIFKRWQSILADHFISHGRTVVLSNSMALTVISCLEGAVILSRGYQTIEPFDAIIDTLSLLVDQGKQDSE